MSDKIQLHDSGKFKVWEHVPEIPATYGTCTREELDIFLKEFFAHQRALFKQSGIDLSTLPRPSKP